jgi:hypothetical protein
MNQNTAVKEVSDEAPIALYTGENTSTAALVLDGTSMERMMDTAKMMASAKVTIPVHLRNSPGDCMAVVIQALQWKMNPFAIAQKTHLSQSGALGYEAQLINAVIVSCGAIKGQPEFEFVGDWSKILGKAKEMKSDKGGKYYVSDWKPSDEEGLGVIVTATLRGEIDPRAVTIMLAQCWPRFSTQWATDPQQQITYVAVRKFSRRYAPGAILGVYTPEELEEIPPEKDVTPAARRPSGAATAEAARAKPDTSSEEAQKRIADLELVAIEQGQKAFRSAWAGTSSEVQKAIGIEQRNRMDALGKKYDESKVIDGHATTINQETGEVQSATVDPDGSFPG